MKPLGRLFSLALVATLVAVGCQSSGGSRSTSDNDFESEQPQESYVGTPAYLNVQMGIGYMRERNFEAALMKLKKALAQNPQLAIAHNTIAVLYEELGQTGKADHHYRRSLQLDRNDSRTHNNFGQYLCKHGKYKEALQHFDTAANNPLYQQSYMALTNAGACALKQRELEQADIYLRRALEKYPKFAPALAGMIEVTAENGRYGMGRDYLKRYVEVGKHNASTLWAAYRIEKNLGNKEAAANYAVRLRSRFPDSIQTKWLVEEISSR